MGRVARADGMTNARIRGVAEAEGEHAAQIHDASGDDMGGDSSGTVRYVPLLL